MAKPVVNGRCRVCGTFGPLSEEHVPPKRAFNDMPYVELTFEETIRLGPDEAPQGPKRQGGVRFRSLCRQCNNDFGGWYAKAFVEWCYRGMDILERSGGNPRLIYAHNIYPLRIIKQVVVMFFSVNSWHFRETFIGHELAWLLKNRDEKGLPPGIRFYSYFNRQGRPRYNPVVTVSKFFEGKASVFSEITYPPYGYVMTLGTEPPDDRLFDITHFARSDWTEARTEYLHLPVLPTHVSGISGDYRNLDEIVRQEERNRRMEADEGEELTLSEKDKVRLAGEFARIVELHSNRYR